MKLKKNKTRYELPAHSQVLNVYIPGNQRHNQMYSVAIQIMPIGHLRFGDAPGMPKACCVDHMGITFAPPPDKPYEVRVQYVPPIMEI